MIPIDCIVVTVFPPNRASEKLAAQEMRNRAGIKKSSGSRIQAGRVEQFYSINEIAQANACISIAHLLQDGGKHTELTAKRLFREKTFKSVIDAMDNAKKNQEPTVTTGNGQNGLIHMN